MELRTFNERKKRLIILYWKPAYSRLPIIFYMIRTKIVSNYKKKKGDKNMSDLKLGVDAQLTPKSISNIQRQLDNIKSFHIKINDIDTSEMTKSIENSVQNATSCITDSLKNVLSIVNDTTSKTVKNAGKVKSNLSYRICLQ